MGQIQNNTKIVDLTFNIGLLCLYQVWVCSYLGSTLAKTTQTLYVDCFANRSGSSRLVCFYQVWVGSYLGSSPAKTTQTLY